MWNFKRFFSHYRTSSISVTLYTWDMAVRCVFWDCNWCQHSMIQPHCQGRDTPINSERGSHLACATVSICIYSTADFKRDFLKVVAAFFCNVVVLKPAKHLFFFKCKRHTLKKAGGGTEKPALGCNPNQLSIIGIDAPVACVESCSWGAVMQASSR